MIKSLTMKTPDQTLIKSLIIKTPDQTLIIPPLVPHLGEADSLHGIGVDHVLGGACVGLEAKVQRLGHELARLKFPRDACPKELAVNLNDKRNSEAGLVRGTPALL